MKTFLLLLLVVLSGALGYNRYQLLNENADLRAKLKEAEGSLKASAASLKGAEANLEAANQKLSTMQLQSQVDLQFQVVKKEYIAGVLVDSGEKEKDTGNPVMKRVSARWLVSFAGVQTKREYPALEVKEASYPQFTEGGVYSRQDLNGARK